MCKTNKNKIFLYSNLLKWCNFESITIKWSKTYLTMMFAKRVMMTRNRVTSKATLPGMAVGGIRNEAQDTQTMPMTGKKSLRKNCEEKRIIRMRNPVRENVAPLLNRISVSAGWRSREVIENTWKKILCVWKIMLEIVLVQYVVKCWIWEIKSTTNRGANKALLPGMAVGGIISGMKPKTHTNNSHDR